MQSVLQTVMLQAAPAQPGGGLMTFLFPVLMIVVLYFFMIRPQAKRAKEQKKFADSMNNGEQIVTTSGIHARINRANEDGTIQIEVSRGTFMTIERSAISMEMTAAARKKAEGSSTAATTTAAPAVSK